jgi:hypothetical protein
MSRFIQISGEGISQQGFGGSLLPAGLRRVVSKTSRQDSGIRSGARRGVSVSR